MAFVGGLPKETVKQVAHALDWTQAREVYVCCSGSFRLEQMLGQVGLPADAKVVGCDVSLLTVAIGELAARQDVRPIKFINQLAFIEDRIGSDPRDRVAALIVASEMSRFKGASTSVRKADGTKGVVPNQYNTLHREHYESSFDSYLANARDKLDKMIGMIRLDTFIARDFRVHATEGVSRGAYILGFLPTYKGGYEQLYKFLDQNIEWEHPAYSVWDPANFSAWLRELHDEGATYCIGVDQRLPPETGFVPCASFENATRKTLFVYARDGKASFLRNIVGTAAFAFRPVVATDIREDSVLRVVPATSQQMNYLKEQFLSRGIAHSSGSTNFLVYVNDALAGGFIYNPDNKCVANGIYLLSDFSITRDNRVSKLIAMLSTSRLCVAVHERQRMVRISTICTTAFTDKPVSMKYRGAYKLTSRLPGRLQYTSGIREQTPQELYNEWYRRQHAARNADHAGAVAGPQGP